MKERPILFSGDMVRAILDGSKTQTRRLRALEPINKMPECWEYRGLNEYSGCFVFAEKGKSSYYEPAQWIRCPYGKIGDRLWVREAFSTVAFGRDFGVEIVYAADEIDFPKVRGLQIESKIPGEYAARYRSLDLKKHSSRFMPRWASCITLEIGDVRVERLQWITPNDALDEGGGLNPTPVRQQYLAASQHAFANLWDSLNAKSGLGWDANPWVWVIEFWRVE